MLVLGTACGDSAPERELGQLGQANQPKLDRDELRADAREGLESAIDDPALGPALERSFTSLAAAPEVVDAAEKLLARVGQAPRLAIPSAEFFAVLQATAGMRAGLAEYARANPRLETVPAITAGFVSHVEARLTRPELVEPLERALSERLAKAGPLVGAAVLREAGGGPRLADRVADRLVDPDLGLAEQLDRRLGSDPTKRGDRLHRVLSDPRHAAEILLAWAEALGQAGGVLFLSGLLDDPAIAPAVADALARVLDDPGFRDQAARVFEQALAAEPDLVAIDREVDALLETAGLEREAAALLAELARHPSVRDRVDAFVDQFAGSPEFEQALLNALD